MAVAVAQQAASSEGLSGTTNTVTLGSASVTGHALIVAVMEYSQVSGSDIPVLPSSISDGTNTFTRVTGCDVTSAATSYGMRCAFYTCLSITGLATETITATWASAAPYNYVLVWELSGNPAVDQSTTGTGTGTSQSAGTKTPAANGSVSCCVWANNCPGAFGRTLDGGWTATLSAAAGNGQSEGAYFPQTTAASLAFHMTSANAGDQWAASGLILIPAAIVVPLAGATGTSSDAIAITAPTHPPLATGTSTSADTLTLTAPTQPPLATGTSVSTDSLTLTAPTRIPLDAAASVSADSLAGLSTPTSSVIPLAGASSTSVSALALSAATAIPLATSASVSADSLSVSVGTGRVPLDNASSVSSAGIAFRVPIYPPLGTSRSVSSAGIVLSTPQSGLPNPPVPGGPFILIPVNDTWLPPPGYKRALPGIVRAEWTHDGSGHHFWTRNPNPLATDALVSTLCVDSGNNLLWYDGDLRPGQIVPFSL